MVAALSLLRLGYRTVFAPPPRLDETNSTCLPAESLNAPRETIALPTTRVSANVIRNLPDHPMWWTGLRKREGYIKPRAVFDLIVGTNGRNDQ